MKNKIFFKTMIILLFFVSCKKDAPIKSIIETIETSEVQNISINSAICGGMLKTTAINTITYKGICWNTSGNPTISDSIKVVVNSADSFKVSLTGLKNAATYYIRAFAISDAGTSYGSEKSFTTIEVSISSSISDIDGNSYNTVKIGNQYWMSANLKTKHFNNGDSIATTNPATADISQEPSPTYQWAYAGNENNVDTYGRLYTWNVVNDSRKLCPVGWHVPSSEDINTLVSSLGGFEEGGAKLKETGLQHWHEPNSEADNSSELTAVPAGLRDADNTFSGLGYYGYWWTNSIQTILGKEYAVFISLSYSDKKIGGFPSDKMVGISIRCIKD